MTKTVPHVLVAAVFSLAVFLLSGAGWPMLVVGAVLALSLWVILFAGSYALPSGSRGRGTVDARSYAIAAAAALVLGFFFFQFGDGPVWWAVGVIFAGVLAPTVARYARPRGQDG